MAFRHAVLFVLLIFYVSCVKESNAVIKNWVWRCIEDNCERSSKPVEYPQNCDINLQKYFPSVTACRLICGQYGALFPKPTGFIYFKHNISHINYENINIKFSEVDYEANTFLTNIFDIFKENLHKECGQKCRPKGKKLNIDIDVSSSSLVLAWGTFENYTLQITPFDEVIHVKIEASTVFGARHGLESLNQLIASYSTPSQGDCEGYSYLVIAEKVQIKDKPVYIHRGLLLDTSRNFLSINAIKRQIDGLAASKMNVLHWHATDSHSFPIRSEKVPYLSKYGAYSSKKTYSISEIKDLIDYAKLRGVRIILEIDSPAHAGNGWQWGPKEGLGDLAVCVNQHPWRGFCVQPPCGQMNPINPHLYDVLEKLYGEIIETFPKGEVFHMGGDEVCFQCWNTTTEIVQYLRKHKKGNSPDAFLNLWAHFHKEAVKRYDHQAGNEDTDFVIWSSQLTHPDVITRYLSKDRFVVQTWVPYMDDLPNRLLSLGYRIIVSTKDAWYLDHGFWGRTNYYNWQDVYNNRIMEDPKVLGGEVCSWGEYADDQNIDPRNWPRAAAAGERLWSNPVSSHIPAQARFIRHRDRLISRGIRADAITPRWCTQNEGKCP